MQQRSSETKRANRHAGHYRVLARRRHSAFCSTSCMPVPSLDRIITSDFRPCLHCSNSLSGGQSRPAKDDTLGHVRVAFTDSAAKAQVTGPGPLGNHAAHILLVN